MRATLGTHKDFGQTCGACQVNCARRVSIRCIALAGTSVGWSSVILFFFLPPSCVPWLHARYAILSRYTQPESRTPDIGCLKMSASPEVQPPGLQSTGLRRCPCLKKADRFGSAPSRTSECANRPQITEKSTGLCQEFWNQEGQCGRYVQGRLSVLTDLLNRLALQTLLVGWDTGERALAVEHLSALEPEDIALLDRGFASYELFARFIARQRYFVCRCAKSGFAVVNQLFEENQAGQSVIVELRPPNRTVGGIRAAGLPEGIQVRLVTLRLSTGELEVLATNLLDEAVYVTAALGELYHYRWRIETYYGLLKSRLDLENFTGRSPEAVRQDVYATIFLSNLESVLTRPTQRQMTHASPPRQHASQVNRAVSFHALKSHIIELLLSQVPPQQVIPKLEGLFAGAPVTIRPGRKVPRKKASAWRSYWFQRHVRKSVF